MSQKITAVSFVPRFFGAFGQFFKYLGSGDYAARCQALAQGEKFAFEEAAEVSSKPEVVIKEVVREVEVPAPMLGSVNQDGALQLLQLLQQQARFVDFIKEDIQAYSDEEVGAAARQVHSGCASLLEQHFTIDVVSQAAENERMTVPADYDPQQIKLEGLIEGTGPFSGTLIHPGWQVTDVRLPQVSQSSQLSVLAPAEVEV